MPYLVNELSHMYVTTTKVYKIGTRAILSVLIIHAYAIPDLKVIRTCYIKNHNVLVLDVIFLNHLIGPQYL